MTYSKRRSVGPSGAGSNRRRVRPGARRDRGTPMWAKAVGGVALAALLIGAGWAIQRDDVTEFGKIAVLINVDANVAGNGLDQIRDQVTSSAVELAKTGGGELVILKAAGDPARQVGRADLRIQTPDGQLEHDTETIKTVARQRIEQTFDAAAKVPTPGTGRDILSLLTMAANMAPREGLQYQIFMVGFGLGTVEPADARIQMGGDPGQAVEAINDRLPDLTGATINVVFPAAVAPQQPLNVATSNWRRTYWTDLTLAAGAVPGQVIDTNIAAAPTAGAPDAPVIPNLPDPTPVPPQRIPPPPPPEEPQTPLPPVRLAGSLFMPDSAEFVNPDLASDQLAPIADAWQKYPDSYATVDCVGRTAAFGDRGPAVTLSQQRAEAARTLLVAQGVGTVTAIGVGFDDPLPQYDPQAAEQRSVSCQLVLKPQP